MSKEIPTVKEKAPGCTSCVSPTQGKQSTTFRCIPR
ncbi:Protein of unknown function [Gryllus bimaculatus]|nr:Protein of unknown function [Gryllus bimaculatus]